MLQMTSGSGDPEGSEVPISVEMGQLEEHAKAPQMERLFKRLFAGSSRLVVKQLHGGLSGSLVLYAQSFDENGNPDEPVVAKLDGEEEMKTEVEQTKTIHALAGGAGGVITI